MARRNERGATPRRRRRSEKLVSGRSGETNAPLKRPTSGPSPRSGQPPPLPILYLLHHLQAALAALERLRNSPLHSLLTVAVIGIAIALPTAFWLTLDNLEQGTGGWQDGAPRISLFLVQPASKDDLYGLAEQIEQNSRVAEVEPLTADQALAEFRAETELEEALELLNANPLPHVLTVTVSASLNPQEVDDLAQELAQLNQIERMRLDQEWVNRLHALMNLAERALATLAILLAVAVILIIGNTIRLTIESRREEIEIIKLIGGSNGFVRRPFLYEGFWYGCGGGTCAGFITEAGRLTLQQPAQRVADAYAGNITLQGIGLEGAIVLLCGGGLLGLLGAWLAVGRHLASLEPR